MLTRTSRWLTYLTAVLYTFTGAVLFIFPEQMASAFAWKVTPFMTMTIGAWCLGNAWLAWISARRWEWRLVYSALVYLWLFGLLETAVLIAFRDKLVLAHPIAWLYVATLAVNVVTALWGLFDWWRIRPTREPYGPPASGLHRGATLGFGLFVAFLGGYGMLAPIGAPGTNAGIFPEVMSLFTLRAFAAFYLSLCLSSLLLLRERSLAPYLHHAFASYALIVIIIAAAFVYLRLFDFANRPGGLVYFGAYLAVGIPLLFVFRRRGTGYGLTAPRDASPNV